MHHQPCVLRQSLSLAWLPWLLLNTHERLGLWTGFICALHRRGRLYILTKISKKREATRLWLEHRSVCKGALLSGQSLAFASFRNRSPCPSVTAELVLCLDMHLNLSISPAESLSPTWLRLKHWKSETIPFWRHHRLFPLLSTSATHCNLFLCVGLLGSLPATLHPSSLHQVHIPLGLYVRVWECLFPHSITGFLYPFHSYTPQTNIEFDRKLAINVFALNTRTHQLSENASGSLPSVQLDHLDFRIENL